MTVKLVRKETIILVLNIRKYYTMYLNKKVFYLKSCICMFISDNLISN